MKLREGYIPQYRSMPPRHDQMLRAAFARFDVVARKGEVEVPGRVVFEFFFLFPMEII